nr:hypothetical protein [Solidesulfovibrio magneticus]
AFGPVGPPPPAPWVGPRPIAPVPVPYPVPGPGPYAGALWALPAAAAAVTIAGATYYAVGNAYYQPVIQDGSTVYVQVNPPQSGDDDGFGDDD